MSERPKRPSRHAPVDDDARKSRRHKWLRVAASGLGTLLLSWVIVFCVPNVVDVVRAYNFHAPAPVSAINKRLKLADRGTDIFYASNPQIDEKDAFNANCGTQERSTAILGCFYKDRIYLYDLKNTELDGTLEVTAAHEMLHAAYQRLTMFERWWVDKMIVAEYDKVKDDTIIKQLMAYYTVAEPGAEIDELHSILGTVMAKLDPDLEHYYTKYFNDRAAVVALNTKYNQVFNDIQTQSEALEQKLSIEEPEITTLLVQYDADRTKLEADIASFNARAKANQFATQAAFNSERSGLLIRIDELNTRRDIINAKVVTYNADVEALNKLSMHTNELYQSMNGAEAMGTLKY